MVLDKQSKQEIKNELVARLSGDQEIRRIVVFGSFVTSPTPSDVDVAVFQDSNQGYLPLAMKYRKQTRPIRRRIPIDILPIQTPVPDNHPFIQEIEGGETIYIR